MDSSHTDHYIALLSDGNGGPPAPTGAGAPLLQLGRRRKCAGPMPHPPSNSFAAKLRQRFSRKALLSAFVCLGCLSALIWLSGRQHYPVSQPLRRGWLSGSLLSSFKRVDASAKVSSRPSLRTPLPRWVNKEKDYILYAERHVIAAFERFMKSFGKHYDTAEEKALRYTIFRRNYYYIKLHNMDKHTYELSINPYADMTWEEFKAAKLSDLKWPSKKRPSKSNNHVDWELLHVDASKLPSKVDWREAGPDGSWNCVTPVKNQQRCGSCWAFSTTGAVEGAFCKANEGRLVSLSEQQMVDCASAEGNEGCNGGLMDDAFQYILDAGGLCTEEAYPYTAHDGNCTAQQCARVVIITGYKDVPAMHESALKAAIALRGPISVAIEADLPAFQFYHKGVFDLPCGQTLNHGVLATGYGTEDLGDGRTEDYWLIKNSWGDQWGDGGFIKIARHVGRQGECGVLLQASYPVASRHPIQWRAS